MLPREIQEWKSELHGLHHELLYALEHLGVEFRWQTIEKTLVWFEFQAIYAGRIYGHAPYELAGRLRETVEWVILKTAQVLQKDQHFVFHMDLSEISSFDVWVPRWTDVIEDPGLE
ncbi:hypothetical protein [Deinococcus cellulosilyticus]|uniref:Uncharacterized protein n=1 Tax=Deinococcus cellulosilyticus (strain DSM 18568 / NBRC 106333 / KACC 11606 / 5516J-15) TaxID=1223518 RepID=A0A511NA32_DEIC1|nr:hypothetical protein [Deinococcus cellulosilyticus]GEM49427.1 hypothetical protein DC3_50620 [Deinococcus cellulosilyticus NBRC 106333 = KACC 11606]